MGNDSASQNTYYAHSTDETDCRNWQLLKDHLEEVARLAATFAEPFGAARAARLAGLLHDLGKYTLAFQARLAGAMERVDHSTAGAAVICGLPIKPDDKIVAETLAYAIAGHHAGLPDKLGSEFSTLTDRLKRFSASTLAPVWAQEITPDACGLLPRFFATVKDKNRLPFSLAFFGRMIFSCLVDADFKETENFYAITKESCVDRDWPDLQSILPRLSDAYECHMGRLNQSGNRNAASPIQTLRQNILVHVRSRAIETPGLFTLTVPTGGGKTLASLGFALDHAKAHSAFRRIIYAAPYTAIIDQTAQIFRKALGEGSNGEIVLEHHSSIEETGSAPSAPQNADSRQASKNKLKLAMEDWAAPVIVTTNVQLFESLYAAKPSRCRKLHNIAGSIIILDEAQTLPLPLLAPATWALQELAERYGCTVILCTATQPALEECHFRDNPQFKNKPMGLPLKGRELAPDPVNLAHTLARVQVRRAGPMEDGALIDALAEQYQGLIVVNSRKHALALYRSAQNAGIDGLIHLSTRQYAAHRRRILEEIRHRLGQEKLGRENLPCRVIATSLVEAGVDLDFPKVWRAEAGLDQIVQAAGRCNREGRRPREESIVTVFNAPEYPSPKDIKILGDAMNRIADKYDDLLSLEAIEGFFKETYWLKGARLDEEDLWACFKTSGLETSFSYRTAAEKFQMIEDRMLPVIIANDEKARKTIEKLAIEGIPSGKIARELQSYIVQIPPKARQALIDRGHVEYAAERLRGDQFAILRYEDLYDPNVGLLWDEPDFITEKNRII